MIKTRHSPNLTRNTSVNPIVFFQFLFLMAAIAMVVLNVFIPSYTQNLQNWMPPDLAPAANYIAIENGAITWKHKPEGVGIRLSDVTDLAENKTHVMLVVVVSSAPVRRERRDAIRDTWWKRCRSGKVNWGERLEYCHR